MAKQKKQRGTGKRSTKMASVLDRLRPEEAQTVLRRLLAVHRELRSEAQQIAKSLLSEVEFKWVADEVEEAVRDLGLDELGSRAGRHSWGYTEPSEAAWELLEERVSPFIEDVKRQSELGLDAESLEMCKGVVLGQYRVRNEQGDDVLQWAPDVPAETAAHAAATWRNGRDKKTAGRGRQHGVRLGAGQAPDRSQSDAEHGRCGDRHRVSFTVNVIVVSQKTSWESSVLGPFCELFPCAHRKAETGRRQAGRLIGRCELFEE